MSGPDIADRLRLSRSICHPVCTCPFSSYRNRFFKTVSPLNGEKSFNTRERNENNTPPWDCSYRHRRRNRSFVLLFSEALFSFSWNRSGSNSATRSFVSAGDADFAKHRDFWLYRVESRVRSNVYTIQRQNRTR